MSWSKEKLVQLAAQAGVHDVPGEALLKFAQSIAQIERRRSVNICVMHAEQQDPKGVTPEGRVRFDQDRLTARVLANRIAAT